MFDTFIQSLTIALVIVTFLGVMALNKKMNLLFDEIRQTQTDLYLGH